MSELASRSTVRSHWLSLSLSLSLTSDENIVHRDRGSRPGSAVNIWQSLIYKHVTVIDASLPRKDRPFFIFGVHTSPRRDPFPPILRLYQTLSVLPSLLLDQATDQRRVISRKHRRDSPSFPATSSRRRRSLCTMPFVRVSASRTSDTPETIAIDPTSRFHLVLGHYALRNTKLRKSYS